MKIGQTLYAVIDPATDEVLGDGDAPTIYSWNPDTKQMKFIRDFCECPDAKAVTVQLVLTPPTKEQR